MRRLLRKRTETVGLPPGALIHIGDRVVDAPRITLFDYDQEHLEEVEVASIADSLPFKERPHTVTWINVEGIHDVTILQQIGQYFDVHPLTLETILNTEQRPKMEESEETISIILKMLQYDDEGYYHTVVIEQVSIILGKGFVLTLQEGKIGDVFEPIRDRIRNKTGRIRESGVDYLVYALVDVIVDNYFVVLENIGEHIEALEARVVAEPIVEVLQEIRELKQEMIQLRRAIWPLREVVSSLERSASGLSLPATTPYWRSVYEHVIQVMDATEVYREILSVTLDIYLSSVNNRMTSIMNVLTVIMSIFIPLTFIVGVYGMNFRYMPELSWRWGYPLVWGVMLVVGLLMLVYFWRRRWL
jgi:magnesium transporter